MTMYTILRKNLQVNLQFSSFCKSTSFVIIGIGSKLDVFKSISDVIFEIIFILNVLILTKNQKNVQNISS